LRSSGHFAANYTLYFVLTWLPLYLVKDRGFSIREMAEFGALAYCIFGASAVAAGWTCDRLIARGAALDSVRKATIVIGHVGAALCLLASAMGGSMVALTGLLATGVFFGLTHSCLFAIAQTIAGPHAAGKWVALQNCIANFGGIVAPIATGFIVDRTGLFAGAFALASAIALLGALAWGLVIPRVEPIDWTQEP
jgi:fucose permease